MSILKKMFKPIQDGTVKLVEALKIAKAATPTVEEFISPLRRELKEIYTLKTSVCNYHCVGCKYNSSGCTLDRQAMEAVESKEDPEPYLIEIRDSIIGLTNTLNETSSVIDEYQQYMKPQNKLKWAMIGLSSGVASYGIIELIKYLLANI